MIPEREAPSSPGDTSYAARSRPIAGLLVAAIFAGLAMILLSFIANYVGLGRNPGFGWKKTLTLLTGLLLSVSGTWLLCTTRARQKLLPAVLGYLGMAMVGLGLAAHQLHLGHNPELRWTKALLFILGLGLVIAAARLFHTRCEVNRVIRDALMFLGFTSVAVAIAASPLGLAADPAFRVKTMLLLSFGMCVSGAAVLLRPRSRQTQHGMEPSTTTPQGNIPATHSSAPRFDLGLLVLLALPWILFLASIDWVFGYVLGGAFLDPWFYLGFFLDLPVYINAFPDTYYGSRLSWILPGYVVFKVFPSLIAPYVLHVGFYYASVVSLYSVLKHTVGKRAALLSGVLMGLYGYFLWAAGWDYVDAAGITYLLLTILALTYSARNQSDIWLISSGISYGTMIHSQLFLITFTPALVVYFLALVAPRTSVASLLRATILFGAGLSAISVALGAANSALGGHFLFYEPSVQAAIGLAGRPNPWRLPFATWWKNAWWLVVPSMASIGSVLFLLINRRYWCDPKTRPLVSLQVLFLACVAISFSWELKGSPVLQLNYYASFLIPGSFLALGVQLAPTVDRWKRSQFTLAMCAIITILTLAYRFQGSNDHWFSWLSAHVTLLVLVMVPMGVMGLFISRGPARSVALSILCLIFALVNIFHYPVKNSSRASKSTFLAIMESVKVIREIDPSGRLLFWYQAKEPQGIAYTAICSIYLWGYRLINDRFPSLEEGSDSMRRPQADELIVVLSDEKNAFQSADLALQKVGLRGELVAARTIRGVWNLTFIRVQALATIEIVGLRSEQTLSECTCLNRRTAQPRYNSFAVFGIPIRARDG